MSSTESSSEQTPINDEINDIANMRLYDPDVPDLYRWEMLPPPVNDRSFETIDEAWDWLADWASVQGYAVSKKTSYTGKHTGIVPKVWFQCARGGEYKDRRKPEIAGIPRRRTVHLATECPFLCELSIDRSGLYSVSYIEDSDHNHYGAPPEAYAASRRQDLKRRKAEILRQFE